MLFLQGLHPRTPVAEVKNLTRLVQRSHQLLYANRWRPEQATTGDFDRAAPDLRVRARARAMPSLRHTRFSRTFGPLGQERRSFWCPRCQPLIGRSGGAECAVRSAAVVARLLGDLGARGEPFGR